MTQLCTALKDHSIFKEVLDHKATWNGYLLGKMIHGDSSIELKIEDVIDKCRKRGHFWNVFQLERSINISQITDVKQKLNTGSMFDTTSISETNYFPKFGNESQDIKFGTFNETFEYALPLLQFDLDQLIADLLDYRSVYMKSLDVAAGTNETIKKVRSFKENIYQPILQELAINVTKFQNQSFYATIELEELSENVSTLQNETNDYFDNIFLGQINKTFEVEIESIIQVLENYGKYLSKELTTNIGECSFISKFYDSSANLFCFYWTDSINSICLSLGMVVTSYMLCLPIMLNLIQHYRISALDFECETEETLSSSLLKYRVGQSIALSCDGDAQWT